MADKKDSNKEEKKEEVTKTEKDLKEKNKNEIIGERRRNKYNIVNEGSKDKKRAKAKKVDDKKAMKDNKEKKSKNLKADKKLNAKIKKADDNKVKTKTSFLMYFSIVVMILAILVLAFLYIKDNYLLFSKRPTMTVELEGYGSFTVELYPDKAPNTVAYIIQLAEQGFYNGKVVYGKDGFAYHFGREENGMEPKAKMSMINPNVPKDSLYDVECEIDGEFEKNDFKGNDIPHEKYTLSLTRADYSQILKNLQKQSYNSGTPQFKVLYKDAPTMNGYYAAFGKVIEGQEVIDKLEKQPLRFKMDETTINEFRDFIKINKITIDRNGYRAEKIKAHKKFSLEEFFIDFYNKNKKVQ